MTYSAHLYSGIKVSKTQQDITEKNFICKRIHRYNFLIIEINDFKQKDRGFKFDSTYLCFYAITLPIEDFCFLLMCHTELETHKFYRKQYSKY